MYDSADDTQFPRGAQAYAAYLDGAIASQPNYSWIVAEFPNAHHLSITLNAALDADALDIENGAATPAQALGWWQKQRSAGASRPCLYASASTMQASIVPMVKAGTIPRASVRLWSAHYAGEHVCAPGTCGAVSLAMDGTQWTDMAYGRNLDESLLLASFFTTPAPAPVPEPVPAWQEAIMNKLPTLAEGAKDTKEPWMVRRVQALCNAVASPVAIDGDYGAATKAAVMAVQKDHGVTVDGTVGPVTWAVLVTGSAS